VTTVPSARRPGPPSLPIKRIPNGGVLHVDRPAVSRVRVSGAGSFYDGGVTEETNEARHPRRSYPKGVRRRQQILDGAIALLAQRGVDRASLRTIG
jgi:hypothetical protein